MDLAIAEDDQAEEDERKRDKKDLARIKAAQDDRAWAELRAEDQSMFSVAVGMEMRCIGGCDCHASVLSYFKSCLVLYSYRGKLLTALKSLRFKLIGTAIKA